MNTLTRIDRPLFGPCMVAALALAAGTPAGWPGEAPPPLPSGIVDFAGRISHNHWYLFGLEQRPELEALNRDLREAQQQTRNAPDETARQAAGERLAVAAGRLLQRVKSCPRLLRVDLAGGQPKLAAHGPVELPGDTGALLIEVLAGGEGVSYTTGLADMSQPAGESSLVPLDAAANGATYAVAGLEHVPFGRTTLTLEFRRPGQPPVRLLLDVATPAPGRLELTVLSDDTGEPAPAMVQLLSQTDGSERQPANGLTFAPQFDKQGNTSGARAANLPGALHEPFWCMPGPVGMALAPGTWDRRAPRRRARGGLPGGHAPFRRNDPGRAPSPALGEHAPAWVVVGRRSRPLPDCLRRGCAPPPGVGAGRGHSPRQHRQDGRHLPDLLRATRLRPRLPGRRRRLRPGPRPGMPTHP